MTDARLHVLVVDDDEDQRYLLRRALERRAGAFAVSEATNGAEAIELAGAGAVDLVVLDLNMPVMSGLEALPRLADVAGCPIVVLSNLPELEHRRPAEAAGAVGYLQKQGAVDATLDEVFLLAGLVSAAQRLVVSAHTTLPADTASVRRARRFVRSTLGDEADGLLDLVVLLVSELVTNAVVHARTDARVEVRLRRDAVRVDVHDADPVLPEPRVPDQGGPGGRGLLLVDQVASRWGADPRPDGKVVWFELSRP